MTDRTALRSKDQEARRAAQTEYKRPLMLEAGAGTGKTTTLVNRMLIWSLGPGWEEAAQAFEVGENEETRNHEIAQQVLDGLVAITFTEAAAAKLAGDMASGLAQLARDPNAKPVGLDLQLLDAGDDTDEARGRVQRRAHALVGALDHLAVRTIHSFCRKILAGHPLEARLHPELTIDPDEALHEEIVREVVEERLRESFQKDQDRPLTGLALRGIGPQKIADTLTRLATARFPASTLKIDPLRTDILEVLQNRLHDALAAVGEIVEDRLGALKNTTNAIQTVKVIAETLEALNGLRDFGTPNAEAFICAIDGFRDKIARKRISTWAGAKKRFGKEEADLLGERAEELSARSAALSPLIEHVVKLDPELLDTARKALAPLLAEVEGRVRARGIVSYDALLIEALNLLRNRPAVLARNRQQIRQLLVDEFQDTDRTQCEIVQQLALTGAEEARPGLFLVGDPKQSIYGWRNADLAAYDEFKQKVFANGGLCLPLAENFRSVPAILDEVNLAIDPVMHEAIGLQPPFQALLPCDRNQDKPGFDKADRKPVEYWVTWAPQGGQDIRVRSKTLANRSREIEAQAIAAEIRDLHDHHGIQLGDVAILLRRSTALEIYLDALRRAGLPFAVTGAKQYYRRREIIDAAALVRAIVHPDDHIALLTFMRSPLVGVPDAALIPLWSREFPRLLTRLQQPDVASLADIHEVIDQTAGETPNDIPGLDRLDGWTKSLKTAVVTLARLRQAFLEDPPDRFVERLRNSLSIEVTEAARFPGRFRLANIERFLRRLAEDLESSGGDIQSIARLLRRAVTESPDADEALPPVAAKNAVQVLTIHKAKGLQFKQVYLPDLHAKGSGSTDEQVPKFDERRRGKPDCEYRLFGAPTPLFYEVEERAARIATAERVRTLYVAMTRAADRMVLCATWPENPSPVEWDDAKSELELLTNRGGLPDSLGELEDELQAGGKDRADIDAMHWRFPALSPESETAPIRLKETPDLPTPKQIRADEEYLAGKRDDSTNRMSRSLLLPASHETGTALEERLAALTEPETVTSDQPATGDSARQVATAAGIVLHQILESWDLQADPVAELTRQRDLLLPRLHLHVDEDQIETARKLAAALVDRFVGGDIREKFLELGENVLARELPVLLPNNPEAGNGGPLSAYTGTIDLLYRDPESGDPVIVDFKTDRVEGEAEIRERASLYANQERIYRHAVQEALDLGYPPRFELWFIWPDKIVGN